MTGNGFRVRWITPDSSLPLLGYYIRLKMDDAEGHGAYTEYRGPVVTDVNQKTGSECDTFSFTSRDSVCERTDESFFCPSFICGSSGERTYTEYTFRQSDWDLPDNDRTYVFEIAPYNSDGRAEFFCARV